MNLFRKHKPVAVEQTYTEEQWGNMAERFAKSEHWEFFCALVESTARECILPTVNPNEAMASVNAAATVRDLIGRVQAAIESKNKRFAAERAEDEPKRRLCIPITHPVSA